MEYLAFAVALIGVAVGAYQRGRHVQAKQDLKMIDAFVDAPQGPLTRDEDGIFLAPDK